ncbi:MAG: glycosyltransferase family 4 protein [Cyclobacteriaceae bacterium]
MHIIFNPPDNIENKYIKLMVEPLSRAGFHIHALDNIFSSIRHFRSIRLVHLNWFENLNDESFAKGFNSFLRKAFILTVIRLSGKKLVWTMHNRMSHERKTGKMSRIISNWLIRWADIIIIHCEQSRALLLNTFPDTAAKIRYLPHPDFVGCYGGSIEKSKPDDTLKLLFVGTIKPYKNIEVLIGAMKQVGDNAHLTIAGNPKSTTYAQELKIMAANSTNITLKLEFIPDEQLPNLIGQCDLLILPYDLESSLNSGTVILAFSYQKTVICPEIGTLADMMEMKDNFLSYRYKSPEEHFSRITEVIQQAIKMKIEDPNIFEQKGQTMFKYISQKNNKKEVGEGLVEIYNEILNSNK